MELFDSIWVVLAYVVGVRVVVSLPQGLLRDGLFASANVAAVALIYDWGVYYWAIAAYVAFALLQYWISFGLRFTRHRVLPAVLFPVVALLMLKYLPDSVYESIGLSGSSGGPVFIGMVGLSYMVFRLSYLVTEVRNGIAAKPNVLQYLSFSFFLPTLAVGPISRYETFAQSYTQPEVDLGQVSASLLRVLMGAAKFVFIAPIFSQFQFEALLLDGRSHHLVEVAFASVGFYFYLYFNFSGFCDIAIGIAGLVGIRVDENFNSPILARNVQDFWNRWHMTLNAYMRDLVFTPVSKWLVHRMGVKYLNVAVTIVLFVVFLLIGVWHGRELQYLYFGLIHAFGVAAVYLWGVYLKKWLGLKSYKIYMASPVITFAARALTFVYVSTSFVVFANSPEQIEVILQSVSGG